MAQRLVSIIDADAKLASYLLGELARYGLTVEIEVDANDLMSRKDSLPELVVLCIDPKRTGWAVCNRLRKSPLLKSIPLVITSAEATEKDFDDHKKLKTRAEEYLHKPFSIDALVDKIATLIGLAPVEAEAEAEIEVEGEIEVESDDLARAEEEFAVEEPSAAHVQAESGSFDTAGEEESTRIGFPSEIDGEVDLETNAAFAAIGLDDPASDAPPQAAARADARSPFDDDPFDGPDEQAAEDRALQAAAPVQGTPVVTIAQAPADTDSVPVPKLDANDLGLGLDDVAREAEAMSARTPPPVAAAFVAVPAPAEALPALKAELDQAKAELDRLRKENEELKARPKADPAATSSFSREREFLTLRETINKKEKELLDLRDGLDSKDRLLLDGKEKLREAERKVREAEERSLTTEREMVAAREKMEALGNDKERGLEREKQVKARLEDAQKAQQRLETELEQWRTKHASDTAALDEKHTQAVAKQREEMGALRQSHAEAMAELKTEHGNVLAQQLTEMEAAGEAARKLLAESLASRTREHKAELESELKAAERRQGEALVDLEAKHEATVKTLRDEHEDTIQGARAKHEAALKAQSEESRRKLEQAAAEHATAKSSLEEAHLQALETAETQRAEALAAAAEQAANDRAQALAQSQSEHETELKAAREQHSRKLQALEESHEDLKAGMQARHASQQEELKKQHAAQVATFEGYLAERDRQITQHQEARAELDVALTAERGEVAARTQQIETLVAELEAAQAEIEQKSTSLAERAQRITELEQDSARYQDQVLRAYQRIKSDESIVARAKKALAIALTLLEENGPENEQAKS